MFTTSDEKLMSTAECSKCKSEEVYANLQECIICDRFIDGCVDCYMKHVFTHTMEEVNAAKEELCGVEIENSLPYMQWHWYNLN